MSSGDTRIRTAVRLAKGECRLGRILVLAANKAKSRRGIEETIIENSDEKSAGQMREHGANPRCVRNDSRQGFESAGDVLQLTFDSTRSRAGKVVADSVVFKVLQNIV